MIIHFLIMKTNYVIKHLGGTLVFFSLLFISAGRIDYWPGVIYVIIGLIMFILNYTILRIDADLLKERSKPGENTLKWDKSILGLTLLSTLAMYIVAGLDSGRFHWSHNFHPGLIMLGAILTASGQLIFLIAQKQNKFFSSTVRIQSDRNHEVCDSGLYRVVRHPAYLGTFIQSVGFPILFESYWSIIPVGFSIVLLLIRTYKEDQTLKTKLKGYHEYCIKTKYKLIPYIW